MDGVVHNSRDMIRRGSRSFAAAARLFSPEVREGAYLLYAWCRYCDDQIDGQVLGMAAGHPATVPAEPKIDRLEALQRETRRALAGQPVEDPVFEAFQRVTCRYHIPEHFPLEMLEGFRMDVEGADYHELDQTLLYCYRVAGVVGIMMAFVMGVRDRDALQRAADLGIAFQLTNISRDVIDDAAAGRCYLPRNWLEPAGLTPASHADPANREALAGVIRRILAEADRYYVSAQQGLRTLSFRSAWAVATALSVYRDIGRIVVRRGTSAWDQRAVVATPDKYRHAMWGFARAARARAIEAMRPSPPRDDYLWTDAALRAGER